MSAWGRRHDSVGVFADAKRVGGNFEPRALRCRLRFHRWAYIRTTIHGQGRACRNCGTVKE